MVSMLFAAAIPGGGEGGHRGVQNRAWVGMPLPLSPA